MRVQPQQKMSHFVFPVQPSDIDPDQSTDEGPFQAKASSVRDLTLSKRKRSPIGLITPETKKAQMSGGFYYPDALMACKFIVAYCQHMGSWADINFRHMIAFIGQKKKTEEKRELEAQIRKGLKVLVKINVLEDGQDGYVKIKPNFIREVEKVWGKKP